MKFAAGLENPKSRAIACDDVEAICQQLSVMGVEVRGCGSGDSSRS